MAKSSTNYGSGIVSSEPKEEFKVDSVSATTYNIEESVVKIRSLFDGRLEYTGQGTGKQYTWNKAGSIVEVLASDASHLLEKRIGKQACCGDSRDGVAIFEMAD